MTNPDRDTEICGCACHGQRKVVHNIACCYECLFCKKRIASWAFDEHKSNCASKPSERDEISED